MPELNNEQKPKDRLREIYPYPNKLRRELWELFIASVDNTQESTIIISDRALMILHVSEVLTEEIYSDTGPPAE